jgi:transcription elongation GreA/GreB family factor
MEIPIVVKAQLVEEKMRLWTNTSYAAQIDLRVAKKLNDPQQEKAALEMMKKCEEAIMLLEEMLEELNSGKIAEGTFLDDGKEVKI